MNKKLQKQQGFTIVELMIATTVLSVILLLVTLVMTSIGGLYSKGINQANIQSSARNIVDDVSQNLQLSNGYTSAAQVYCIGDQRYTYVLGKQIGNGTAHALWRDTTPSTGCDTTGVNLNNDPASPGGTELVSPRSRLAQFDITGTYPYTITVKVIYGDSDLLCDSGTPGDCTNSSPSSLIWNPTAPSSGAAVICKGRSGDQFCAAATLSTSVAARIKVQ